MSNKSHEISGYLDDIPMRLSERYRPLDFSAITEEPIVIPDPSDQLYKFNAELYALEVFEFRDKQRRQLSESMSKLNLKSNHKLDRKQREMRAENRRDGIKQSENRTINSMHLNPGEILKPLPKISDNYNNMKPISDNTNDPNLNIKRKIVKDFESDTSSPFDYVELQTIDDMQELNDVFQAFQSKTSQTKQTVNENNVKTVNNFSDTNNSLNQINCEQNPTVVPNINGTNFSVGYGYQTGNSSSVTINMSNCDSVLDPNNWMTTNTTTGYRISQNFSNTADNSGHHSNGCQQLSDSHNNLRSSKSASDLPTLVANEDSSANCSRRQRSHTPPCAPTKSKSKKYLNVKQTLVLNDPYEELSQKSKHLVDSISSMGFERSRVARAVKHMDNDHKQVIDFLLQIQALEESGYDSCEAEIALHMNSQQISDAKKFLEALRQLSEVGLDKKDIIKALVKCNNDRDRALDILLNTEHTEHTD